jgi:hypothetical protein
METPPGSLHLAAGITTLRPVAARAASAKLLRATKHCQPLCTDRYLFDRCCPAVMVGETAEWATDATRRGRGEPRREEERTSN